MLLSTLQARKSLHQPDEQDSGFLTSFLCLKYRFGTLPEEHDLVYLE